MISQPEQGRTLENMITRFSTSKCSDPRDRVYAILPMEVKESSQPSLTIIYGEPLLDLLFRTIEYCALIDLEAGRKPELSYFHGLKRAFALNSVEILRSLPSRAVRLGDYGVDVGDLLHWVY
jgi:hypothetical protein